MSGKLECNLFNHQTYLESDEWTDARLAASSAGVSPGFCTSVVTVEGVTASGGSWVAADGGDVSSGEVVGVFSGAGGGGGTSAGVAAAEASCLGTHTDEEGEDEEEDAGSDVEEESGGGADSGVDFGGV